MFNQASSSNILMNEMNEKRTSMWEVREWVHSVRACREHDMAWTQRMYGVCVLYSEAHDL